MAEPNHVSVCTSLNPIRFRCLSRNGLGFSGSYPFGLYNQRGCHNIRGVENHVEPRVQGCLRPKGPACRRRLGRSSVIFENKGMSVLELSRVIVRARRFLDLPRVVVLGVRRGVHHHVARLNLPMLFRLRGLPRGLENSYLGGSCGERSGKTQVIIGVILSMWYQSAKLITVS